MRNPAGVLLLFFSCVLMFSYPGWAMGKRPPKKPAAPVSQPVSVTLEECYGLALQRSETVAIRREEIARTTAQFLEATGEAVGNVDFVMTDFFQKPQKGDGSGGSVGTSLTAPEKRERKFVISQPLFQGFKALGALQGAGSLRKQRTAERVRAEELLFLDVVHAFYGLLRQAKDVDAIEGIHNLFEQRIGELGEREKIGRSRASETATARAQMKILDAELARSRGALAIARQILEFLTGLPFDPKQLQETDLPQSSAPEVSFSTGGVESRSDVEASEQAMKTAWRNVIVTQSDLWPKITLESNQYERREGFQSGIDWDVLFKVNVPLFKGGETAGKVKEAVSSWKEAKLSYSLVKRQADLEIKQTYQDWKTSLERHKALEEAVKASEENYELQRDEYSRNLVNNLDVLQAMESLLDTRRQANEAYYAVKENSWRFEVASGKFREEGSVP